MLIDLHCHTKKIKQGDAETRNVTAEVFAQKLNNANIKIAAITNHNHYDHEQYLNFKAALGASCMLWPGVELDVKGRKSTDGQVNKGHLIVVANPDKELSFFHALQNMLEDIDVDTILFSLTDVYYALNDCDVIYVFHDHKKPSLDESDIQELRDLLHNDSRIFSEPSNLKTLGVFSNLGKSMLIGSDVRDWSRYEASNFADIRLPISTFRQFCKLAEKDVQVVNTLLDDRKYGIVMSHPVQNVDVPLTLYKDINVIFGQKGTGKSVMLHSMIFELEQQGNTVAVYSGSDKEDAFKNYMNCDGILRDVHKVGVDSCTEEFEYILQFSDRMPTKFDQYSDWFSTKDNNANKSRMKITDATHLPITENPEIRSLKKSYSDINSVIELLAGISAGKYIGTYQAGVLTQITAQLERAIWKSLFSEVSVQYATELSNDSIDKIKNIADKHSNTKSRPSTTGFYDYAIGRKKLHDAAYRILLSISGQCKEEDQFLGELEEKGKVYIRTRYRMLTENNDSRTGEFSSGIQTLRKIRNYLYDIVHHWADNDLQQALTEFRSLCYQENINSTNAFLGVSKLIVLNGNEYSPSNGEKSILLLQDTLNREADVYLLDEPELGMGNSYIDATIRPKLMELAKQRKIVVIATHNANLAVRTLPYMSIFRAYEGGKYLTYTGNPFSDNLVNIEDQSDTKSWKKESMHTLEGGYEAFYERKDIYESSGDNS